MNIGFIPFNCDIGVWDDIFWAEFVHKELKRNWRDERAERQMMMKQRIKMREMIPSPFPWTCTSEENMDVLKDLFVCRDEYKL